MRQFFTTFFAALLALGVFTLVLFFLGIGLFSAATAEDKPNVKSGTILVLDISKVLMEQPEDLGPLAANSTGGDILGLHDFIQAIDHAAADSAIKGIFLTGTYNPNGYAGSQELRAALLRFKASKKFITAYGSFIDQQAYSVMSVADDIYINPAGSLEWVGYGMQLVFFKDALSKLGVQPEIFYAGKFKSATEPYRLNKMSDENRLQLRTILEDIYGDFLKEAAARSKKDTASLRQMAAQLSILTAQDAADGGLVTGLAYDDEVRQKMADRTKVNRIDDLKLMSVSDYHKSYDKASGGDGEVAVLYAQGDIVDGTGGDGSIGGDAMRQMIRKLRFDKDVKAVVFRVNSPGGSALASEVMWRELSLLRKEKPLVVSMGDYAASGGYYISCMADSIFTMPGTLTGSIGVFTMLFDATLLMESKLGIHFDEVTTAAPAGMGSPFRKLTAVERRYFQEGVDSIYDKFITRVAEGRKLRKTYVDSIGQGRVWSGVKAVQLGLADKIGDQQAAIACAARMAKLKNYRVTEWPELKSFWDKFLQGKEKDQLQASLQAARQQLGFEVWWSWRQAQNLKGMAGQPQLRLPFVVKPAAW
ncbi:MAG: signal peptide peptidase SppA [Chitinophagaceae bacterium]|nr:signal peptide peptidase SppA [Chitinophagaceae bacterium]